MVRIGKPSSEVFAEGIEVHSSSLERGLSPVEQMIHRDPIHPRLDRCLSSKGAETSQDLDQDLLGSVLGVAGLGNHSQRKLVDVVLYGSHERLDFGVVTITNSVDHVH